MADEKIKLVEFHTGNTLAVDISNYLKQLRGADNDGTK